MKKHVQFAILLVLVLAAGVFSQEKPVSEPRRFVFVNELAILDNDFGVKNLQKLAELAKSGRADIKPNDSTAAAEGSSTVYNPALNDLNDFLKIIENKYDLVILKLDEANQKNLLLGVNPKFDITRTLISFLNDKSKKSIESLKIEVPAGKIATIDTGIFHNPENGIKQLGKLREKYKTREEICANTPVCRQIGQAMQEYGLKKGYVFILDSGRELPAEIKSSGPVDVTGEFIADFNKNNN